MILWCAYCQHFLGEDEPFDHYRISYGVCAACKPKIHAFSETDQDHLEATVAFFIRLEECALAGAHLDVLNILAEGQALGLRPVDLMMGMLQPLLARIGDLWASNQLTVHAEHRFSSLVADLVAQVRTTSTQVARPSSPDLMLVNAAENYHTLGLQMADVYFATQGISTLAVAPGLPTREILDLVAAHRPRALGFSVALPSHMKQVLEVAEQFRRLPHAPRHLLVGGPAIRLGLHLEPSLGIELCPDLSHAQACLAADPLTKLP